MTATPPARHVRLDPIGGIAGDMFLAAVLDAFPEHAAGTIAAMRACGLPESVTVDLVAHDDHRLTGRQLRIEGRDALARPAGSAAAIRARLAGAPLADAVRARAVAILDLLIDAEARVHGRPPEHVHFHELAGWDSVADIAGAAWLIEAVGPAGWSVGPLPAGSGRVETAHGPLPVPPPAVTLLLQGYPMIDDGRPGERVTPTGAALLRHLAAPGAGLPDGRWAPRQVGHGFGRRRLDAMSNVLRALAFEAAPADRPADAVLVVAFEIDDQTGEDLAVGLDRLRDVPGVLDVSQVPAWGKKGRMVARVQVLCEADVLEPVAEACFRETATIGLRWHRAERRVLARSIAERPADGRLVRVKRAERPGGATAKAEIDDVADLAGHARRRATRAAAEAAAIDAEEA